MALAAASLVAVLIVVGFAISRSGDDGAGPSEPGTTLADRFGTTSAEVVSPGGGARRLTLLLADTPEERRRGLMDVRDPELGGHDGMLFRFPDDTSTGFWMRNTPMPLSIAFVDADGGLVSTADMEPCGDTSDCPSYRPEGPFRFALEVPQGRLADLGVEAGATLEVG